VTPDCNMGRSIEAPVFWPTKADMATESSFERYIESIEKEVASVGICKIVAPKVSLHGTGCAVFPIALQHLAADETALLAFGCRHVREAQCRQHDRYRIEGSRA